MCLAILTQPGAELDMDAIKRAWKANPDGGGFAFTADGEHITIRKFLRLKDMREGLLKAHRRFGKVSPFIIHFRLATHGSTTLANVHPFKVRDDLVMVHNGIINVKCFDDRSDSKVFAEDWLTDLPADWLDNHVLTMLVEDFIGWSKLVFLSTDPGLDHDWYILNEHDGHWNDERTIWYSNDSYKKRPVRTGYAVGKAGTATQPFRDDGDDDVWRDVPALSWDDCYFCEDKIPRDEAPWCFVCQVCNNCWQFLEDCFCIGTPQAAKVRYIREVAARESATNEEVL